MDPRQTRKVTAKVEIIREGRSMRKMRLSDIMSEGFSTYLMKLDGDFIAPTGARLSSILEAPTDDQIKARAGQIWQRKGSPQNQTPEQMKDDYLTARNELESEEEIAAAQSEFSPTTPENQEAILGSQTHVPDQAQSLSGALDSDGTAQVGPDDSPASDDDSSSGPTNANDAAGSLDSDDGQNPATPADLDAHDDSDASAPASKDDKSSDSAADIADPESEKSSKDKNDDGPDEFDEKNRAFTNYIDGLIKGGTGSSSGDNLSESSERIDRGSYSLIEAVYGPKKLEIVNYKLSR